MLITVAMLQEAGACTEQLAVFEREWPQGGEVTLATCKRAQQLGLDLDWAAKALLTAPALAEYKKVTAPAWAEYEKVTAPALVTAAALMDYGAHK